MHAAALLVRTLKNLNSLKYVFRVLPGILFLFSATAKLIGIDAFEIYLFSFGWFSLGTSFLLARLVIAAEYTLGLLLIANLCPKTAWWGAVAMLAGFSVFLAWLALSGNRENCNCFGELVNLNPIQSLVKNLLMLVLLLPAYNVKPFQCRFKALWITLMAVVPLAAVLIVSPPDNWRYSSYDRSEPINRQAFQEALEQELLPASLVEGDRVVCFYSLKCRFCKLSARKIVTLRERGEFSEAPLIAVFGRGEDTDPTAFLEETGISFDEIHFLEPDNFLLITNGAFPVIAILHDGEITAIYNYRNLH